MQYDKRIRRTWRKPKSRNTRRFNQNNIKKYQIEKYYAMMEYIDSGLRNSPPFVID